MVRLESDNEEISSEIEVALRYKLLVHWLQYLQYLHCLHCFVVYTVHTVYIVYPIYIDYIVYTVYTIQTALHCSNSSMYRVSQKHIS